MIIRDATSADVPEIAALWNALIRSSAATFNSQEKQYDDVEVAVTGNPGFFVAWDEALLGYATYFQLRGGVGYARTMEHSIQIAPSAAGRGAGRALMAHLEAHAKSAGVHSLWAGVSGENPAGVKFHRAIGFELVATLPEVGFKFDRYMDLILMQKRL